jgi:hypothetical protein
MPRDLPPRFVDDRELTDAEQRGLDALLPREVQTGDSRRDLVEAAHVVSRRMRQHELDVAYVGAVFNALYRDVRSWRRIQTLTGVAFTTARYWAMKWRGEHLSGDGDDAVDTAV